MKSTTKTPSERQFLRLVKRARRGDNAAFDSLVEVKGEDILYTCISLMKNRQDGEDVAQDVVIRLKKEIVKLEKPEAFGGWMYRVIYTTCMNAKKRNNRLPDLDEQAIMNAPLEEERDEFLPQKYAETEESRKRLLAAIDELPDKQRACILFFYYSDMSYAEIADSLETNEQDVANCLNRAKKRLKATLEADESMMAASAPLPVKGAGVLGAASVITMALESQAHALVTPQMLGMLEIAATSVAIGGGVAAAGATNIIGGLSAIPAKIAATVTSVAVVGGGAAAAYTVVKEDPPVTPPALVEPQQEEVAPDPVIEEVTPEAKVTPTQTVSTLYEVTFVEQSTEEADAANSADATEEQKTGVALTLANFPQEGLLEVMTQYDLDGDGYLTAEELALIPTVVTVESEVPAEDEKEAKE